MCYDSAAEAANVWDSRASEVVASLLEKAAEQPLASPWISVEDRLPEDDIAILVVDDGRVIAGRFECEQWFLVGTYINLHDVTHWMPMPEPPKEGES